MSKEKDLYEFLVEAELQHYYDIFKNDLKVNTVAHLKYVEIEDLTEMGMTKPEMRRLKKYYKKECPNNALGKIKRILSYRVSGEFPQPGSPPPASPATHRTAAKHIIPSDAISIHKTLGSGEFGTVQQGIWTNEEGERIQVAIKTLSKNKMQGGTNDFLKEASIMYSIDHDHVVRLYGVVFSTETLLLVTELAPLRSLLECIKEPAMRQNFTIPILCEFAVQVADGMSYLEKNRLIHRDLAARNILVFAKDKVKVSDFGLSRALGVGEEYYQTNFNVNLKLPIAWCAPECINYLRFTTASDMWAYGVTIWEMFSYGFQPWAAFTGQKILEAIDEPHCQRLEQPECCPKEYYAIMLKCWEHDPKRRPKFSDLVSMLPQIKPEQVQAVHDFPNPTAKKDYLYYTASDIITVLNKKPENPPESNMWKGVLNNSNSGKTGYFDPSNTAPFIELSTTSPRHNGKSKMSRKDSSRKSKSSASSKKISREMISRPQNDLRHTGHIGYDGAMFGDVAFIGDNYDKLPVKVVSPYKPQDDLNSSSSSIPKLGDFSEKGSASDLSLIKPNTNGSLSAFASETDSPSGSGTLTDGSSNRGDGDSLRNVESGTAHDDFSLDDDFDSFKMPDFSTSLDLGSSFMDEVMKALHEPKDDEPLTSSPPKEEKPLFDNIDFRSPVISLSPSSSPPKSYSTSPPKSVETSLPSGEKEKKRKSKLKIEIPPYNTESKKQAKVKPMSASDEKKIDRAIEIANQMAQMSAHDVSSPVSACVETPKSSHDCLDPDSSYGSPKLRSVFSFKKSRSPKQEKRTFSDDIAAVADLNEEVTPQAQEAYNMLVVKGSVKHPSSQRRHPSSPPPPPPPAAARQATSSPQPRRQHSPVHTKRQPSPVLAKPQPSPVLTKPQSSPVPHERQPSPLKQTLDEHSPVREIVTETSPVTPTVNEPSLTKSTLSETETTVPKEVSPKEPLRQSRERRTRRSLEHHNVSQESITEAIAAQAKNGHGKNLNLREPQGIPGRKSSVKSSQEDTETQEYNPLRRLRDSQVPVVMSRSRASRMEAQNGLARNEKIRRPNLQAQLQFLPRFRDGQSDADGIRTTSSGGAQIGVAEPQRRILRDVDNDGDHDSHRMEEDVNGVNALPLPPRQPVRPGLLHQKPRERKYPLKMETDNEGVSCHGKTDNLCVDSDGSAPSEASRSSCERMLNVHDSGSGAVRKHSVVGSGDAKSKYHIENVKISASDLGVNDTSDLFWTKNVNFAEYAPLNDSNSDSKFGECSNMDNVSYEDLLEFALDHGAETDGKQICDEVQLMQRLFTDEVTRTSCLEALDETGCDVEKAIKLIKLKQLMSTQLADVHTCKQALLRCDWDVTEAANYIFSSPLSQMSPDCVDV